jgi:hypothetical protein
MHQNSSIRTNGPRILCASALGVLLALAGSSPHAAAPNAPGGLPSLTAIASLSDGVVRDTNGDGIADAVVARIVVPAHASVAEATAATDLAARLGFETSALTLPIVLNDTADIPRGAIPIVVGYDNALIKKVTGAVASVADLKPGQGLIAAARTVDGTPAIIVAGRDDEGTLAAAREMAGRLPRLWNMSGITLPAIEDQVSAFLRSHGVNPGHPILSAIVVDSNRRGIDSVHIVLPGEANASAVARVAGDLDAAHRRGAEPATLNYAEAASVVLHTGATHAAIRRAGLNQRTLTPPIDPNELATDSPGDRGAPAAAARAGGKTFDLSNVYSISGWFGDAYADLIPDATETSLVLGSSDDVVAAAHIAARLGLETTGLTLPIAKADREVRDPARESNPILIGRTNELTQRLTKIGRARLDDVKPGEGVVQVIPHAFGAGAATVVAGADAAGTEAAALYLARRTPYVWDNTRGALSYDDVSDETGKFLAGRSAAGQASQALHELDAVLDDLAGKKIASLDAKLYLESANPGLDKYLAERIEQRLKIQPKVSSQAMTDPVPVIDETFDVPWEVDDFWARFRKDVLPSIKAGSKVDLELRVSESPAVRQQIASQVKAELTKAGATEPQVVVLSAYKQGYLWMTERVLPALKGRSVRAIHVKVAEYKPDFSKKYKFYQVPSRWVHELYPVDEIIQRELGIPKDKFSMELVDSPKDIYTVDALDSSGRVVQTFTFSPKFVEREYLEKFPGWSRVDVTTGWLRADVDGRTIADARIETDPERFWDHYQASVLPKIYDYVMKVTDNRPMPDKQPFHRDLDVEVWMSEPDFRIGVDEEQVSALESLHEDLYFVTLDFFDALGRTTTKRRLAAPGKIFPIIHPDQPGKPGKVHILYAGNASAKPKLEISYTEADAAKPTRISRELGKIDATAPQVMRVIARENGVSELELQTEAKDDREAGRAADALDALKTLQQNGLYRTALSYSHVDRVAVDIGLKDVHTRRLIPATGVSSPSNVRVAAKGARPHVTWDHIISPDEAEEIVGQMAAFPQVKAYKAGHSYRGREISVMEITQPTPSELVSLAKLTTLKPTIFITGRQHANEVSSTSHILRLAELLCTDPQYTPILEKVNVVLQPVENPDGAAMAYELQKLTPNHMLHAGRYSALGMDVASQVGQADPLLPEALVRGRLWQDWLPDIYLNPHGYPSHEWVQQFAGYVPPGFRTYWSTRGWYTTVTTLRDPRYPAYADATAALREAIVREVNGNADVRAMNLRAQDRYRRWAFGFAPYVYNQEIYKETAIYYSDPETGEPRGSRRAGVARFGGGGRAAMSSWPQVTFVSGGTETPDETAQGEWLNLVTKPGLSYLMAHVKYLRDGQYKVDRIEEDGGQQQRETTSITLLRVRPVMPGRATATTATASPSGGR